MLLRFFCENKVLESCKISWKDRKVTMICYISWNGSRKNPENSVKPPIERLFSENGEKPIVNFLESWIFCEMEANFADNEENISWKLDESKKFRQNADWISIKCRILVETFRTQRKKKILNWKVGFSVKTPKSKKTALENFAKSWIFRENDERRNLSVIDRIQNPIFRETDENLGNLQFPQSNFPWNQLKQTVDLNFS